MCIIHIIRVDKLSCRENIINESLCLTAADLGGLTTPNFVNVIFTNQVNRRWDEKTVSAIPVNLNVFLRQLS